MTTALDPDKRWCRRCYAELVFEPTQYRWIPADSPEEWNCTPTQIHDPSREIPKMWKEIEL